MAEKIQIILKEDVANLGRSGELVAVKAGYGRNFLIPQGLAIVATKKNIARLDHEKKVIELRSAKRRKDADGIKARLEKVTVQIERQVGEGDKLFGSVTTRDVEEALAAQGIQVDRRKIHLADPIKGLGQYTVDVKLSPDVTGQVKVWVVAKS
jgi:large subunit ribosomal protein L9